MGISVDSQFANREFAKQIGVTFPVLSDFQKSVSRAYGVLNEDRGFAHRTTFVVDKEGIIRHIETDAAAIDPGGAHAVCSRLGHKKR